MKPQTFQWQGIDETGKKVSGFFTTDNFEACKAMLLEKKIMPITIKQQFKLALPKINPKIKTKHIAAFSRQLASLISAGIPLAHALTIIGDDFNHEKFQSIIIDLKHQIEAGHTLTSALQKYPKHFSPLICNLINVGEQSGTLEVLLHHIANYNEKLELQKHKITKALIYPTIVIIVSVVVATVLLIFVVPQFQEMFVNAGSQLPAFTRFVIDLAKFIKSSGWIIVLLIIFITIAFRLAIKHSSNFTNQIDSMLLKTPIIGSIITNAIISRVSKILAITLKAGLPILRSLNIAASIVSNQRYHSAIMAISQLVNNGQSLNSAIRKQELFPFTVIQLITIGEESGKLDDMLEKIASDSEQTLNHLTDNLNSLIEPLIMIFLGIIVGGLVISMYLPMFRLGNVL